MNPNPQTNVFITDGSGNNLYQNGQASVDLNTQVVKVWGGIRIPGALFYYGQSYYIQGNPSLGNDTLFWWKDSSDALYFCIDNS